MCVGQHGCGVNQQMARCGRHSPSMPCQSHEYRSDATIVVLGELEDLLNVLSNDLEIACERLWLAAGGRNYGHGACC